MDFVDRPNLPVRRAMVAEARNRVALQVWLRARILLPRIVKVKAVSVRNFMRQIAAELVRLDRPRRGSGKDTARAIVCDWNKVNQACIR